MSLHPTTLALLRAVRENATVGDYAVAWRDAGCPDLPVPRYVPTAPGWYWREPAIGRTISQVWRSDEDGTLRWGPNRRVEPDDVVDPCWLGPVEPWREPAPKRTAEEARANPMPGDRWQWAAEPGHYTLFERRPSGWRVRYADGCIGLFQPSQIGEPGETYLGHFPVESPSVTVSGAPKAGG